MVHASYKHNNSTYDVIFITDYGYIKEDMKSVLDTISDTDLDVYKSHMKISVDQKLAYAIWKEGNRVGFIYNRVDGVKYKGVSIKVTGAVPVLLAMKTMFEIHDSHKISFIPHTNNIKDFLSMVYGPDVRAYYSGTNDVILRRDMLVPKGIKMYKYLGIEKVA